MNNESIERYGDELYAAMRERKVVAPLTEREPGITNEDAYRIAERILTRRKKDGERVVGKKIGATSKAVQNMLDIQQPDFGYLTDVMRFDNGADVPISTRLIQPKAEGEIAFLLNRELQGPGVTEADVLNATESVIACFEIVDSRIRDWQIKIQDTIADNASCGLFVLGDERVDPRGVDLVNCRMVVETNGEVVATGIGAAALGSPLACVAWLANALGELGTALVPGDIILSGSLVPLLPARAGDSMAEHIDGIGSTSIRFV